MLFSLDSYYYGENWNYNFQSTFLAFILVFIILKKLLSNMPSTGSLIWLNLIIEQKKCKNSLLESNHSLIISSFFGVVSPFSSFPNVICFD